jgi:hypothetical protein
MRWTSSWLAIAPVSVALSPRALRPGVTRDAAQRAPTIELLPAKLSTAGLAPPLAKNIRQANRIIDAKGDLLKEKLASLHRFWSS